MAAEVFPACLRCLAEADSEPVNESGAHERVCRIRSQALSTHYSPIAVIAMKPADR